MTQQSRSLRQPNFREWLTGTYKHGPITVKIRGNDIKAYKDGIEDGVSTVAPTKAGNIFPAHTIVHPDYRRQGVATAMYNTAQIHLGKKMVRSPVQTDDAKALWSKYEP